MKKKDANVEILRTLACILVVLVHVNDLPLIEFDKSILLWKLLLSDGVCFFFIIMGFFMFKNDDFVDYIKKICISILLPAFVLTLINGILYNEIRNNLTNNNFSFLNTLKNMLSWQSDEGIEHLWYIFSYIKIVLLFPILKLIVENQKVRRYVIIFMTSSLLIDDINIFYDFPIEMITYKFFDASVLCVIIGYEIYCVLCSSEKRNNPDKKRTFMYLAGAVICEIIRMLFQYISTRKDIGNILYCRWNCGLAIVTVSFFVMFILNIRFKEDGLLERISIFIGKNSYYIYLVHFLVMAFLYTRWFNEKVSKLVWGSNGYHQNTTVIKELLYISIKGIVVFIISLIISSIINILVKEIRKIYLKIQRKN